MHCGCGVGVYLGKREMRRWSAPTSVGVDINFNCSSNNAPVRISRIRTTDDSLRRGCLRNSNGQEATRLAVAKYSSAPGASLGVCFHERLLTTLRNSTILIPLISTDCRARGVLRANYGEEREIGCGQTGRKEYMQPDNTNFCIFER